MRVGFVGDTVEVDVRGEVDTFSAPELSAVLHAMIEHGHRSVVLGLSAVSFMDAAGLGVIAGGASRLRSRDGTLTLRAPSAMVRRLLSLTGLTEVVSIEAGGAVSSRLGPEEGTDPDPVPVNTGAYAAPPRLRRVASIPADDDVVDGALRLVVALAVATVAGADGVSVSLQRHGHLATVASSDETIAAMDADQYATGEGPCVDASVAGHWFHTESLDVETRWPTFIPRAQALGINAILSTPLVTAGGPVGALNMYSRTAAVFTPEEQQLASVFASEASRILTDAGVDVTDEQLTNRLHAALRSREIIAQAQGVIMERDAVSEDHAYTALRTFSLRTNVPLRTCAAEIVESTRPPPPDPSRQAKQVAGG
jgi:anti-anti-sigma factor